MAASLERNMFKYFANFDMFSLCVDEIDKSRDGALPSCILFFAVFCCLQISQVAASPEY
jgi:hypothetical protein